MSSAETIAVPSAATGKQSNRFDDLPGLLSVFAQVVLVALVMRNTSIETLGFHRVLYLAAGGFVINHLLPLRLRLPFFLLLSLVSMVVALSGSAHWGAPNPALGLARTGMIVGLGLVLIAICHLPIGFWKRAALLLAAGSVAAAFRYGKWDDKTLAVAWPVLAALFMFRVMVYIYDLSTSPRRPTKLQSLAYFFLIPNFCALLFPVIDFRTFCQKYYDEDALVIYQRGARWMTRGISHLLLYRIAHHLFVLDASEVADGTDLIQFVVANVLLYLKISGSFHLFIGILLLFGFNLPETNHRYFLASSFTDYWRRINTYWRAFIMKVFYYPVYFRFKARGPASALTIATLWCFFVTWALHIYQTWWIKGTVTWTWTDALFWSALALLVLANSLWELRKNRPRKLSRGCSTWREASGVILRTALTFVTITVLWSLWSTPTLRLWLHIWSLADMHTLAWGGAVLACVMLATVYYEVLPGRAAPATAPAHAGGRLRRGGLYWEAMACAAPLLVILAATYLPELSRSEPRDSQGFPMATALGRLALDPSLPGQGRGYYENLTADDAGISQFWETMTTVQSPFLPDKSTFINDANAIELAPNFHFERNGLRLDTNRWGMRDRDRNLAKPPATLRIAVLGSSNSMGYGLPVEATFESVLENRLNGEHGADGGFEFLNFSVPGQSPMGQVWMLHERVPAFHPDIVLFVAHQCDYDWVNRDVVRNVRKHVPFPGDFPKLLLSDAGVTSRTFEPFAVARLRPHESEMVAFCYGQMVRECRSADALPVLAFVPMPINLPLDRGKIANLLQIASGAGFNTIDLSDIFAHYRPEELMQHDKGYHSNAKAQAIIAAALYDRLTSDPRIELVSRARRAGASLAIGSMGKDSQD
jgi:hypothetical protein